MTARASIGVTRWGASESVTVPAVTTKAVEQFVDFPLDTPQSVDIVLFATSALPVAGLSVRWTISNGLGSTNRREVFTMAVQDIAAQVPVLLRRPTRQIQISAEVINVLPDERKVDVTAYVSPVFLDCLRLR